MSLRSGLHTAKFKMDNQGPTVEHRELYLTVDIMFMDAI